MTTPSFLLPSSRNFAWNCAVWSTSNGASGSRSNQPTWPSLWVLKSFRGWLLPHSWRSWPNSQTRPQIRPRASTSRASALAGAFSNRAATRLVREKEIVALTTIAVLPAIWQLFATVAMALPSDVRMAPRFRGVARCKRLVDQ